MKINQAKLINAIENNNLIILAGSGLSSKFKLPTWNILVCDILNKIDNDKFKNFIPLLESDVMTAVEVLEKIESEHSIIKEYIKEKFKLSKEHNFETHKKLLQLSSEQIITTNYDNAFEIASDNKIDASVYTDNFNISNINNNQPYIFKLHGNYAEPSNCIIFQKDYDKLYNSDTGALYKLKTLFSEKTILFLGFSFSDVEINNIFNSIDNAFENNNKHFILTTEANKFKDIKFLETIQISDYSQTDDFIDSCISLKEDYESKKSQTEDDKTKEERKDTTQKIAILSPNPIEFESENDINKVINQFDSIEATIFKGTLNIKTLQNIEDFDLLIVISKTYKSNIYIEDENLQSALISVEELTENITNDNVPLILITDKLIEVDINYPYLYISSFKSSIIKKIIYKTLKNKELDLKLTDVKINITKLNFNAFEKGVPESKSFYGNDKVLEIGGKSLKNIVGRIEEQSSIAKRLKNISKSNKLLNIKASGGIGKTTLIKKVAYELYNRGYYKEGVTFKSCENIKNFEGFEGLLIEGFKLNDIINFKEYLTENYNHNKLDSLIILDNFETVMNNLTKEELLKVNELFRFVTDYASIVITSRESINKTEDFEDVYHLPNLSTDDAMILFQKNYGEINNKEDLKILRIEILEDLLNNNPLAINLLTKSITKFKSINYLKDELTENFFQFTNEELSDVFKDDADLNIERTKSIYQSINYSYNSLKTKEKIAFQLLSLFPDGISLSNFKKCFKESNSLIKISDKEFRILRDKSLVENYNGIFQLQPIIRRFSNFQFSKLDNNIKQKYCLDAYCYNCYIVDIFDYITNKSTSSNAYKFTSQHINNLINVLSFIPNIEISKHLVPEKKYLLNYLNNINRIVLNKKHTLLYLNEIFKLKEFFSDLEYADKYIEVLLYRNEYYNFEFDDSYKKLKEILPVEDMNKRLFDNEDYIEKFYKDKICEIHSMEGNTLLYIESHLNNNYNKKMNYSDFFYLGIPYNIVTKKDGFYYFEYQLMDNNLNVDKLSEYIQSLHNDEHLEVMQSTYTLSKVKEIEDKIIKKLVVTNPYTKGLKQLMLAFNNDDVIKKEDLFKKALKNLSHIKYYYLEALYYYTLFLKENNKDEYNEKLDEGLKKSKKFHYQYIYHLFNSIENKIDYNFNYDFYPIEKLENYVKTHNEFWEEYLKK